MSHMCLRLTGLSDQELVAEVQALATQERGATTELIAALVEMDARRLYLGEGCSSLFTYCTQVLRLSEHAAYGRIEAARAAKRFPIVLDLLADGSVTLTSVCLFAPHLTPDNHRAALESARIERGFLEYHHVAPYAAGGETTVENLELRCRAHNAYESELFFGPLIVREARMAWTVSARSGPS